MTPDSNGIAGGVERKLTRPIIGIENRTAQEAFDIMADRIRSHLATTPDPTARTGEGSIGNPIDVAAMRETAAKVADERAAEYAMIPAASILNGARRGEAERIAAAIRALPLPGDAS